MYDRVFGNVEYDCGWCVSEKLSLFNTTYDITCVASAYKTETINKQQRSQYSLFKENRKVIMGNVQHEIKDYVEKNFPAYLNNIKESLVPKELIFHQNGRCRDFI